MHICGHSNWIYLYENALWSSSEDKSDFGQSIKGCVYFGDLKGHLALFQSKCMSFIKSKDVYTFEHVWKCRVVLIWYLIWLECHFYSFNVRPTLKKEISQLQLQNKYFTLRGITLLINSNRHRLAFFILSIGNFFVFFSNKLVFIHVASSCKGSYTLGSQRNNAKMQVFFCTHQVRHEYASKIR